jgi:hypothetical protein
MSIRKAVVRLWGEETRRYFTDVVVEAPESVPDWKIEAMWLRQFDGVADLEWTFTASSGIWPGNCGRRIQPEVQRAASDDDVAQLRLLRTPRGSVVVSPVDPAATASNRGL